MIKINFLYQQIIIIYLLNNFINRSYILIVLYNLSIILIISINIRKFKPKQIMQSKQPQTFCASCNRYILTTNFLIHQGRCERQSSLRSSRVSQRSEKQQNVFDLENSNSKIKSKTQSNNSNSKRLQDNVGKGMKKKMFVEQTEEKIPCNFCGYKQSLEELDTHPNRCQHWEVQCAYCERMFPKSLMEDHTSICQNNPENIQRRHRPRMRRNDAPNQIPMQQQDQYMPQYRPSPLMNFFSFIGSNNNRMSRNQFEDHERYPNLQFFSFSSPSSNPFQMRSNSSDPSSFIRLIQLLARRSNPNQNPGLSQSQMNRLNKIQYNKKGEENDLCTICYCQFEEKEEIIELQCKHIFHQECIFQWIKRVSTCPVCKKALKQANSREQPELDLDSSSQSRSNDRSNGQNNAFNIINRFLRF